MTAIQLPAALVAGDIPFFHQTIDGQWLAAAGVWMGIVAGSFHPLHRGHLGLAACLRRRVAGPLAFELSIGNVDKPTLSADQVCQRLSQFDGIAPVLVTRAVTFAEKAAIMPGATFVVGADTASRIVDAKYGTNVAALRTHRARFLVAERGGLNVDIPTELRDLFDSIPIDEFLCPVSSTELRMK